MAIGELIGGAILGAGLSELVHEIRSRVWGIKVGKNVSVSCLFERIEKYCEDSLYIFAGKTHWISEYDLIPNMIKKGIDVKVLCHNDDINSKSAKQLRDWGIPVKSYPYVNLEVKGLVVDGCICSLYKGHPSKVFLTKRLKKVKEPAMIIYKDVEVVNCFKVLFLNIFGPPN